jgi:hypothetical protein
MMTMDDDDDDDEKESEWNVSRLAAVHYGGM